MSCQVAAPETRYETRDDWSVPTMSGLDLLNERIAGEHFGIAENAGDASHYRLRYAS
jgi:hypothetical protein